MTMTNNSTNLAAALTSTSSRQTRRYKNESNLKVDLSRLIELLGHGPVETEHSIPGGSIDIYVPHHRFVIETKARGAGAAEPLKRQASHDESPKEQLDRYVLSEIRTELSTFDWDPDDRSKQPWLGVVTDGTIWHAWRYPHDDNPSIETLPAVTLDGPRLLAGLDTAFGRGKSSKPWVPAEPANLFRDHETTLAELFHQLPPDVRTRTETKRQLWLDMLRVSGIAPHDDNVDRLFVTHSLLIAIARLVTHGLTSRSSDWHAALDDGFVSWITHSQLGRRWVDALRQTVEKHDWKRRRHDVMQSLYMEFVSEDDRKVFGEYYTPDWLAALIVREALDDTWRSNAIAKAETATLNRTRPQGVGVLDPTCGSGTFLYHAARRILEAPEMRDLGAGRRADITASLVHGIDVHPVAVEIAKTNMMRVLPTAPTAGASAIQIRMGDSLMAENQSTNVFDVTGTMRILTPQRHEISLPMTFVRRPSFPEDMRRLVGAAIDNQPIPPPVLSGLETADCNDLHQARDQLVATIAQEGNSVWTWYAVNLAGPHLLSEQKVDRIVANPPWVKLSDIQDPPRKRTMEEFGKSLGIYQGGKQAPHTDIAAFFIRQARELYLHDRKADPAIWLVKQSSLRAGHWKAFRELHHEALTQSVDLQDLQPFGGGDARRSCLILDHRPMAGTTAPKLTATRRIDPDTNDPAPRPRPHETPETALERIAFTATRTPPPRAPSGYLSATGVALFRQGATITPQVLTHVAATAPTHDADRIRVTTRKSAKAPWNSVTPSTVEIPKAWAIDVYTSNTVPAFTARTMKAIIPINSEGQLLAQQQIHEDDWLLLDELYRARAGAGKNTPATLLSQMNYHDKLTAQLPLQPSTTRNLVLCPTSGDLMRAARACPGGALADSSLYWYVARTAREAGYLTILLNTPCLQHAYTSARESGRHFHLHPWRKVPIPRYDNAKPLHSKIAALCTQAEKTAAQTLATAPEGGQVSLSKKVRKALIDEGIAATMDECARELLPDQTK